MLEPDPTFIDAFKAFEHEGWESVAQPYREAFSSLTAQSIAPLLDAFLEGGVRTRGLLRAQTPEALTAIREATRSDAARYARGNGVEFAMPAVLAVGVKASR